MLRSRITKRECRRTYQSYQNWNSIHKSQLVDNHIDRVAGWESRCRFDGYWMDVIVGAVWCANDGRCFSERLTLRGGKRGWMDTRRMDGWPDCRPTVPGRLAAGGDDGVDAIICWSNTSFSVGGGVVDNGSGPLLTHSCSRQPGGLAPTATPTPTDTPLWHSTSAVGTCLLMMLGEVTRFCGMRDSSGQHDREKCSSKEHWTSEATPFGEEETWLFRCGQAETLWAPSLEHRSLVQVMLLDSHFHLIHQDKLVPEFCKLQRLILGKGLLRSVGFYESTLRLVSCILSSFLQWPWRSLNFLRTRIFKVDQNIKWTRRLNSWGHTREHTQRCQCGWKKAF